MRFRFQIVYITFDEHGNVFSYKLEKEEKSKLLENVRKCS